MSDNVNQDPFRPELINSGWDKDFLVVGLGASAGGVAALRDFFAHVPPDSGMAYVVILHLSPDHDSQLAPLLQRVAPIPVAQVEEAVRVEPDHVYVIPPNRSLEMRDGMLKPSRVAGSEVRRAPVDIFFRALAEAHGARAVAVILSGTGADGSMGMKRVKEMGGLCIVQDPQEAEFGDMTRHSLATGLVDYVLPAAQIPAQIVAYRERLKRIGFTEGEPEAAEADDDALSDIFALLRLRTGHDFSHYKRPTLLRRIARRMGVRQLQTLSSYARFMHEQPEEAGALLNDLLISVTNFFRDRAAFERLELEIVPQLFAGKTADDHVRVWAAGCATGEEAYTLAMILADHAARLASPPQLQVFATDIDERAVAFARDGYYTINDAADVPPERLGRHFVRDGDDGYRIRRELRERVLFAVHNVLKDPPFAHIDLVTCRNLLIYLNRAAQRRVMDVLHFALNPGGYLMLGMSESVDDAADIFSAVDKEHRIYRGRAVQARLFFPVPDGSRAARLGRLPELRPGGERRGAATSYAVLHQQLLERYAPPSVIINEDYDVVHMSEAAGRFMELRGGELSPGLLQLIRPELRLELRAALYQAAQNRAEAVSRAVAVTLEGERKLVQIRVRPTLQGGDPARGFLLVLFDEPAAPAPPAPSAGEAGNGQEPLARRLEEELLEVRAQLTATVEQYELQREELKASNEELQATNEEMRSALEELETSKEELQSINEELTTVNQELKVRIEELSQTTDDFKNLMNSTQIGTVFLDRGLRVKLFTPPALDIFNLIPSDVGRPLSDITSKLDDGRLTEDAEAVLASLRPVERAVWTRDGRAYLMHLSPYRTSEDRINGLVVTFTDITERQRALDALRRSEEQFRRAVEEAPIPVIMQAEDGEVLQISRTWSELTGYAPAETQTFDAWLTRAYGEGADSVRNHVHELFEGDRRSLNIEFPIRTRGGALRHWSFSASSPGALSDGRRFIVGMALDITERKRAEAALRESEESFRAVANLVRDLVWSADASGRAAWFNQRWFEYTGQTPEEAAAGGWLGAVHPDDRGAALDDSRAALSAGHPFRLEHRIRGASGQYRWFLVQAQPLTDEAGRVVRWFGAATDIHEERAAREHLRASQDHMQRVLDAVTDFAIITLDSEGHIESWNSGAERIFGYARQEAVGQHAEIIFTAEDRRRGRPAEEMREAREYGRAADERWHRRKDGSRVFVSGVLSPSGESTPSGFVKIARDLTEQKHAQDELRRAHEELEDRVRERTLELARANESLREEIAERIQTERSRVRLLREIVRAQEDERRRIARDIHDQLGQQMTALRLSLDALHQGCGEDEGVRRKLEQAQALAERLDADVDFLAWELRPAALDDLGLLVALGNFVREWSRHSGVEAEFHTTGMEGERLPPEAESALYRITQEALNNAMKYARASRVDVLLERRDRQVVLIVEDDGVGFDPQQEAREGRGLGLVGMRERATLVGGTLEIESRPGEGTTVFARAPVNFLEGEEE